MALERRGLWTPHQSYDGRTFWYNAATNQSVWNRPNDGVMVAEPPPPPDTAMAVTDVKFHEAQVAGRQGKAQQLGVKRKGGVEEVYAGGVLPPPPLPPGLPPAIPMHMPHAAIAAVPPTSSIPSLPQRGVSVGTTSTLSVAPPPPPPPFLDPAQALKEKMEALAQQAKATTKSKPEVKRFKRGGGKKEGGEGGGESSAYLQMVRDLQAKEKSGDGVGGKWLVR